MQQVTPERTGWRDENISRRHRLWGAACKATDIDFTLIEYHMEEALAKIVALIEYKAKPPPRTLPETQQVKVLADFGTSANIPVFIVYYTANFKKFTVFAANKWAFIRLKKNECVVMTEEKYVCFLYWLRGVNQVPQSVLDDIRKAPLPTATTQVEEQIPPVTTPVGRSRAVQLSLF